MKKLLTAIVFAFLAVVSFGPVTAQAQNEPVLTVTGKLPKGNMKFDLATLNALPGKTIKQPTPWYPEEKTFEGPLASEFLKAIGVTSGTLHVTALNDYSVDIPVEDLQKWPVILATKIDGKPIPVRERGPIFVMYPFKDVPSLSNEAYFAKAIWQVKTIEVR